MPEPLRIFIGLDSRQPVAYQVLAHSIVRRSSKPVTICPLIIEQLPIKRTGLTSFTFSRFLVPWLCDFKGKALFLDADMLCLADIAELFALAERIDLADGVQAVHVVDTDPAFERASLMLFNCWHPDNAGLTPEFIESTDVSLHKIGWTEKIGFLDSAWNYVIPYDKPRTDAKMVHYTAGLPCFAETQPLGYAQEWIDEASRSMSTVTWNELMGSSVHARHVAEFWRNRRAST